MRRARVTLNGVTATMFICFFVLPGGEALEFAGPSDVFEEANRQAGRRVYDIRFISEEARPITCLSGLRVMPDRTIHDPDEPIDTLIVTGARDPLTPASTSLIEWLQRRAPQTRRYGAVCTGAAARQQARHDALAVRTGARRGISRGERRTGSHLRAGWRDVHVGRGYRRCGSGAGPRRGGSGPLDGARRGALAGDVPEAAGRAVSVQCATGRAGRLGHAHPRSAGMVSRQRAGEIVRPRTGAARRHERA